jgi:hypothetical protein
MNIITLLKSKKSLDGGIIPEYLKVICEKESICYNNTFKFPEIGKIYEVKKVIFDFHKQVDGDDNNIWYELKTIPVLLHHCSLFRIIEISDDILDILIKRKIKKFPVVKLLNDLILNNK